MAQRKYSVNAPSAVLGHEPGTEFEAELDPVVEKRLLDGGALKVVTQSAPAPAATPSVTGDAKKGLANG